MSIDDELPRAGGPLVACSVCGRILSYDDTERRYVHGLQDQQNEDHPPVPVHAHDLVDHNARCDFCNVDVPLTEVWTVPATDFELPQLIGFGPNGVGATRPQMSIGDWAACAECVTLVRQQRWTKLIARVLATSPAASTGARERRGAVHKMWLVALYRKLAVHLTTEPYQGTTSRF